jgi:alpha-glucosidase
MAGGSTTVEVALAYGSVSVQVCTPRILHLRLFGPPEVPGASYVGSREWLGEPPESSITSAERGWEIATPYARLQIEAEPFRLAYASPPDRPLLATREGWAAREEAVDPATGERRARVRLRLARAGQDELHFYGLGQGGGGAQFERLGTSRLLWNSHAGHGPGTDMAVPLLVGIGPRGAFGMFFDSTALACLDVGSGARGFLVYEAETSALDLYLLGGPAPADVLGAYAELTGYPLLPPRWALGYLQSTRHWQSTEEIRRVARTLREKRIPCDALVFLSTYGEAKSWNIGVGHLDFEPELWPNPPGLLHELQEELHYRVVTHEYPVLHPQARQFAEAEARGYLLDAAYSRPDPREPRRPQSFAEGQRYLDFSHPEARRWWWEQHRHLVELGIAGWWLDGGEGPPMATQLHGGPGRLLHNVYDLLRMRAFFEGEARDRPDHRPWMLCRSGGAGMQRYGAASWSGDINNAFATFEAQVPLGLNTAMSGVPYWGTDIGGFFHPLPESGELYARWFQFGALCPLFRSHGWVWREHLPWAHGPEVEAICRRYAELRMQLLPYLYTLAWYAHTRGEPLMRPLVYHYPDDPAVWELGSEYLLGPDLLVAPVTRPGATHWPVYLPAGTWYDFWTHARYEGPAGVSVVTPPEIIPLFVRGGALIPTGLVMQRSDERPLDELTLLVYPPAPSRHAEAELYEDDGVTNRYRQGECCVTPLRCVSERERLQIEVGVASGRYTGRSAQRTILLRVWLPDDPAAVLLARRGAPAAPLARGIGPGPEAETVWWREGAFVWVRLPAIAPEEAVSVVMEGLSLRKSNW